MLSAGRTATFHRKEVKTVMKYSKPEILVLGDAALLIEGNKSGPGDDALHPIGVLDGELDD